MERDAHEDGEVIGLDTDGNVICWDAHGQCPYNAGETPEQFGLTNMTEKELRAIGRAPP